METDAATLWERVGGRPEEIRRLGETLEDREKLLWLGRPKPTWNFRRVSSLVMAPVYLVAFTLFFFFSLLAPHVADLMEKEQGLTLDEWVFMVLFVVVPFTIIPAYLVCSPLLDMRRKRRSLYVVTDHRLLALDPGLFRGTLRSWPLRAPLHVERRAAGAGDIIFERLVNPDRELGFMEMENVDAVLPLLRGKPRAGKA